MLLRKWDAAQISYAAEKYMARGTEDILTGQHKSVWVRSLEHKCTCPIGRGILNPLHADNVHGDCDRCACP